MSNKIPKLEENIPILEKSLADEEVVLEEIKENSKGVLQHFNQLFHQMEALFFGVLFSSFWNKLDLLVFYFLPSFVCTPVTFCNFS